MGKEETRAGYGVETRPEREMGWDGFLQEAERMRGWKGQRWKKKKIKERKWEGRKRGRVMECCRLERPG